MRGRTAGPYDARGGTVLRAPLLPMCLGALAVVAACSATGVAPAAHAASSDRTKVAPEPSLADFAAGDRDTIAGMLQDVVGKFRSPYRVFPGAREAAILLRCRVQSVHNGVVGLQCLSAGPELDLVLDDCIDFYYQPDGTRREFGLAAGPLAIGEVRTCVVYGSGFGGKLWKRFLIFPGPCH